MKITTGNFCDSPAEKSRYNGCLSVLQPYSSGGVMYCFGFECRAPSAMWSFQSMLGNRKYHKKNSLASSQTADVF
jgi:hypothetical protein